MPQEHAEACHDQGHARPKATERGRDGTLEREVQQRPDHSPSRNPGLNGWSLVYSIFLNGMKRCSVLLVYRSTLLWLYAFWLST
jgi:hypothetical protein